MSSGSANKYIILILLSISSAPWRCIKDKSRTSTSGSIPHGGYRFQTRTSWVSNFILTPYHGVSHYWFGRDRIRRDSHTTFKFKFLGRNPHDLVPVASTVSLDTKLLKRSIKNIYYILLYIL